MTKDEQELTRFTGEDALAICTTPATLSIMFVDRSSSMLQHAESMKAAMADHLRAIKNPPDGREQFCTIISFADGYRVEMPIKHASQIIPEQEVAGYAPTWKYAPLENCL